MREKTADSGYGSWEGLPIYEVLGSGFRGQAGWQGLGAGRQGEIEIPVVLWTNVVDRIYGDDEHWWKQSTYEEASAAVAEWAAKRQAIVVSADKEDHGWMSRAYKEAEEAGAEAVVFEGLS